MQERFLVEDDRMIGGASSTYSKATVDVTIQNQERVQLGKSTTRRPHVDVLPTPILVENGIGTVRPTQVLEDVFVPIARIRSVK